MLGVSPLLKVLPPSALAILRTLDRSLRKTPLLCQFMPSQRSPVDEIMRQRQAAEFRLTPRHAEEPKRILFNTQFHWPFACVDYSLATALKLRGHDPHVLACGGLPEYCEQQTCTAQRPSCEECHDRIREYCTAFGLPCLTMNDYISAQDAAQARELANGQSVEQLLALEVRGIRVGELARLNLMHYFKGYPFEIEGEYEAVFRRCLHSAVLIACAASRLMDAYRPDMVVTVNGKFLQWAPIVELAKQWDIPFVTWEDMNLIPGGVAIARNGIAHEQHVDEVWAAERSRSLTEAARREVFEYFTHWKAGKLGQWQYYDEDTTHDPTGVRAQLGLRADAPLVSLFPGICWDSTSAGLEGGFRSVFDWLFQVVAYARRRPELEFVIRAHPAEKRVSREFWTRTTVCEEVSARCAPLPDNVKLVDSVSPVSSYALAGLSRVVMVYTSTLGLEFALQGLRPWVVGRPYYAGRGFTLDLESAAHMTELLDRDTFTNHLSGGEVDLAVHLAHIVRFRRVFAFPYWNAGRFSPPSFEVLYPGGSVVLDDLCAHVLGARSYLDIGQRAAVAAGT